MDTLVSADTKLTSSEMVDKLRQALADSDPMVLRAAIYCITGDESLFDGKFTYEDALFGPIPTISDPDELAKLHATAIDACTRLWNGEISYREPDREQLRRAMELCTGDDLPSEDLDIYLEEAGFASRAIDWNTEGAPKSVENFKVLVIGAGMGGIMAAKRLREMGIPYEIVEKNDGVGGTWHANHYPGARTDVPSHMYSYPWEIDYHWKHVFPPQPEIKAYFEMVAERHQVKDGVQFETEIVATRWDDADNIWEATARGKNGGERIIRANAIISATGLLDRPKYPQIDGMDEFEGTTVHTALWDDDLDLTGKRVVLIGTGASGMQIAPTIAHDVEKLTVMQRSPAWVLPMEQYHAEIPADVDWLRDHVPTYANWVRFRMAYSSMDKFHDVYEVDPDWDHTQGSLSAGNHRMRVTCLEHMLKQLEGRDDLLEKCMPHFPPMVTRFVLDNGWFNTVKRDNVDLCPDGVQKITSTGIITGAGEAIDCDVIILATGFNANDFMWPMEVVGRGGKRLQDFWAKDGGRAYLGIAMPGFPNYYCLYGPNTNPSSNSPFSYDALQIRYALGCVREMVENNYKALDLDEGVFDAFQEKLDAELSRMIWMDQSAKSYYRNEHGRVAVMSPWLFNDYWRWTREPDLNEFEIIR